MEERGHSGLRVHLQSTEMIAQSHLEVILLLGKNA